MKVHFIAIGGSAMHNLAIALHLKGYNVTGSDDSIFEPSKSRLKKYDLHPEKIGWDRSRISDDIDCVILGMHAKEDNLELQEAKKESIKIYSYPEFIYEMSKEKTRVVIGGSHGKTSITAMVLHVLSNNGISVDYMVGAQLKGFETMVHLTEENDFILLEGDEYLSSPIDRRPKFHLYKPNIALLSGISWDHINVFPSKEEYSKQFEFFNASTTCKTSGFLYSSNNFSLSLCILVPFPPAMTRPIIMKQKLVMMIVLLIHYLHPSHHQ